MLTLALVVAFSAIIILFSREFGALFKKIFAISGAKLFLPLIVITSLIVLYEPWVYFALLYIKRNLHYLITLGADGLPFTMGAISLVSIAILMAFALLPTYLIDVWSIRKTHIPFSHSKFLGVFLWLMVLILIVTGFN